MTEYLGVVENQDLTVQIVTPAKGFTVEDNFTIMGVTNGHIITRDDLPTVSQLSSAWRYDPVNNLVYTDLAKAKEIVVEKSEKVVKKQLADIRHAGEEAVDNDDTVKMAAIKPDRQKVRNTLAAKIAAINACTTVAEVEAYLP